MSKFPKIILNCFSKSKDEKVQLKKLNELKQSLDEEKKKNDELLTELKKGFKLIKTMLNEKENEEFCFDGYSTSTESEVLILVNTIMHKFDSLATKLETLCSTYVQFLQEELLFLKKRYKMLEEDKMDLEREAEHFKSDMEKKLADQVGQYEQIQERSRQEFQKLKGDIIYLQTQAESQAQIQQLRDNTNASLKKEMEHRIKELELELSKTKLQEDSTKAEVEKYRHLYIQEMKSKEALSTKLNEVYKRIVVLKTKLHEETLRNKTLLSSVTTKPVQACSCVGNSNQSLWVHKSLHHTESLVVPTLNPQSSINSMENYLTKTRPQLLPPLRTEPRKDVFPTRRQLLPPIRSEQRTAKDELENFGVALRRSSLSSEDLISEASQEHTDLQ